MPPCKAQDVSKILSLVQGKKYYITYWDILQNKELTVKAYTSTSRGECYSGVLNNNNGLYTGVSFNAISTGEYNGQ